MKKEYKKPQLKKMGEETNFVPAIVASAALAVGYMAGRVVKNVMGNSLSNRTKKLEKIEVCNHV